MGSQGDGDDDHLRMAVVENICQYPVKLKLISSPNKIEVDGSNWNAEFNKAEWQQEPKLELEAAEPVRKVKEEDESDKMSDVNVVSGKNIYHSSN